MFKRGDKIKFKQEYYYLMSEDRQKRVYTVTDVGAFGTEVTVDADYNGFVSTTYFLLVRNGSIKSKNLPHWW